MKNEEKEYEFTFDREGKYLITNKYLVSAILYSVMSKDLKGLTLSQIYDLLPSAPDNDKYIETLSQEFGGIETKETVRDIIFKLDVKLNDLNSIINVNIELERAIQSGYDLVNRALVYACQNLLATTKDGEYNDINKTYSIWICMSNHISKVEGIKNVNSPTSFIHSYCMGKKDGLSEDLLYNKRVDKINLVFIELGEIIKYCDNFKNVEDYKLVTKYMTKLFKNQTKNELNNAIKKLSNEFEGRELKDRGVVDMTSRIYTVSELEEGKRKAEETVNICKKYIKLISVKKMLVEEAIKELSEEYNKSKEEISSIIL